MQDGFGRQRHERRRHIQQPDKAGNHEQCDDQQQDRQITRSEQPFEHYA